VTNPLIRANVMKRIVAELNKSNPMVSRHRGGWREMNDQQAVVFNTSAAVPVPSTRWWTGATRVVAMAMRLIFVTPPAGSRPKRRHYPPRNFWLQDARTEREIHRP